MSTTYKDIKSKVAGVSHRNNDGSSRQEYIKKYCRPGKRLIFIREPNNPYEDTAIAIYVNKSKRKGSGIVQIGYVKSEISKDLAPIMDQGIQVSGEIMNVTGGTKEKKTRGVNLEIMVEDSDYKKSSQTSSTQSRFTTLKGLLIAGVVLICSIAACLALTGK